MGDCPYCGGDSDLGSTTATCTILDRRLSRSSEKKFSDAPRELEESELEAVLEFPNQNGSRERASNIMDDKTKNPRKIFVGGVGQKTSQETLREYFSQFGEVSECVLVSQKKTGKSRGFGFVTFYEKENSDRVLKIQHKISDVLVECRSALPKGEAKAAAMHDTVYMPNKVFVGGVPDSMDEKKFKDYFSAFGHVQEAVLAYDKTTHRPRGFGFITFAEASSVPASVGIHPYDGKSMEAKTSVPRVPNRNKQIDKPDKLRTKQSKNPRGEDGGMKFTPANYDLQQELPPAPSQMKQLVEPLQEGPIPEKTLSWPERPPSVPVLNMNFDQNLPRYYNVSHPVYPPILVGSQVPNPQFQVGTPSIGVMLSPIAMNSPCGHVRMAGRLGYVDQQNGSARFTLDSPTSSDCSQVYPVEPNHSPRFYAWSPNNYVVSPRQHSPREAPTADSSSGVYCLAPETNYEE